MHYLLFALLFLFIVSADEPSAFEIQSGATKKEMNELKTSKEKVDSIVLDFQSKIRNLEYSVDGLKTMIEGLSISSRNDSLKFKSQSDKILFLESNLQSIGLAQNAQAELMATFKTQIDTNVKNIESLNKRIEEFSDALETMSEKMLDEIRKIADQVQNMQNSILKTSDSKKQTKKQMLDLSKQDIKTTMTRAKKLYLDKKNDDAIYYFEFLATKDSVSAEANFYLGELYYRKKNYNKALSYFKISASKNDDTKYMPILLWHTAWSFKYLKDNVNYKKFLNILVSNYPKSEQGKKAVDLLKKS